MNSLSSHVLDTTLGKPAAGMQLQLTAPNGQTVQGQTDCNGRCNNWQDISVEPGVYCLRFNTGEYLQSAHGSGFYPHVDIHFTVAQDGGHYHIPLLISPYGFSSYRGS
jgi:5-hydroxyisourate hydrolase